MLSEIFVSRGYYLAWFVIYVVYVIYLLGVLNGTQIKQGKQIQGHIQRLYGAAHIQVIIALVLVLFSVVNLFLKLDLIFVMLGTFITFGIALVTLVYMRSVELEAKIVMGQKIKLLREGDDNILLNKQKRVNKLFWVSVLVSTFVYILIGVDGIRSLSWSLLWLPETAPIYVYLEWEATKIIILLLANLLPYLVVKRSIGIYSQYKASIGVQ